MMRVFGKLVLIGIVGAFAAQPAWADSSVSSLGCATARARKLPNAWA
jgi:hypothetical protein